MRKRREKERNADISVQPVGADFSLMHVPSAGADFNLMHVYSTCNQWKKNYECTCSNYKANDNLLSCSYFHIEEFGTKRVDNRS